VRHILLDFILSFSQRHRRRFLFPESWKQFFEAFREPRYVLLRFRSANIAAAAALRALSAPSLFQTVAPRLPCLFW